MAGQNVV